MGAKMADIKDLEAELEYLNKMIERGEEFEAEGYDCGTMNAINISIRNQVREELRVLQKYDWLEKNSKRILSRYE